MRALVEKSPGVDQGGKTSVRELISSLVFNPVDRTIHLHGERVVMQRAAVGSELRRELVDLLGAKEARVFLLRLGFMCGRADARFVRTKWPGLNVGDAFTAGTRLHTFSGVVRVETVYNEFDVRQKRFAAEFTWHDSVEASEFLRHNRETTEPVCWTQLGYASGYASEFFDSLIIYKEVQCRAQGHSHCRVVGKPAEGWSAGDPEVALFRERIAAQVDDQRIEPRRQIRFRRAAMALTELDRVVLAPVRSQLDQLGAVALPVLIAGAPGTGRHRAARYLHQLVGGNAAELRHVGGVEVNLDLCSEIAAARRDNRRGHSDRSIIIDGIERVPNEIQQWLARSIERSSAVGGPKILALAAGDELLARDAMRPELWYALSSAVVSMPALAERPSDRLSIARALLPELASRIGTQTPDLEAGVAGAIQQRDWPGNLRQMRSVLSALLVNHRNGRRITSAEFSKTYNRLARKAGTSSDLRSLLDGALADGSFSIAEFEQEAYAAAVARTDGNLSAAARLLGLSRAQLAYRIVRQRDASNA